jgi:hypothetical protein
VPCTKNNSCAAILLNGQGTPDLEALFVQVKAWMLADFQEGSDPGLCVAALPVAAEITDFGRRAQQTLVTQDQARALAAEHGVLLQGLGGDEDGVIGALSAVGLAACGDDGRYVLVGRSRQLFGLQAVPDVLAAGIAAVRTADGRPVTEGAVQTDRLRPARRGGQPIAVVEREADHWLPLKLD